MCVLVCARACVRVYAHKIPPTIKLEGVVREHGASCPMEGLSTTNSTIFLHMLANPSRPLTLICPKGAHKHPPMFDNCLKYPVSLNVDPDLMFNSRSTSPRVSPWQHLQNNPTCKNYKFATLHMRVTHHFFHFVPTINKAPYKDAPHSHT